MLRGFFAVLFLLLLLPTRLPAPPELKLQRVPKIALDSESRLQTSALEAYIPAWKAMLEANAAQVALMGAIIDRQRQAILAEAERVKARVGDNLFSRFYTAMAEALEGKVHPFGYFAQRYFPVCAGAFTAKECEAKLLGLRDRFDDPALLAEGREFERRTRDAQGEDVLRVALEHRQWSSVRFGQIRLVAEQAVSTRYPDYSWVHEDADSVAFEYLSIAFSFQDLLDLRYEYPYLPHFIVSAQPTDDVERKRNLRGISTFVVGATKGMELKPVQVRMVSGNRDGYSPTLHNAIADARFVEYLLVGAHGSRALAPVKVERPWAWSSGASVRDARRTVRLRYKIHQSTEFEPMLGCDGQISRTTQWAVVGDFAECKGAVNRAIGDPAPLAPSVDLPPVE